jgi:hypothetical protein
MIRVANVGPIGPRQILDTPFVVEALFGFMDQRERRIGAASGGDEPEPSVRQSPALSGVV